MTKIILEQMIFSYANNVEWFVDTSFSGGNVYQLIGANGSGKSTIGKLLTSIFEPCSGEILLDDEVIRKFSSKRKRLNFLFIPQEPQWSFLGSTYAKHLKNMKIERTSSSVLIGNSKIDKMISNVENMPIFSMSQEQIFLLILHEIALWERSVIFIDECPDIENYDLLDFFLSILVLRNNKGYLTFASRHIKMELSNLNSTSININEYRRP